LIVVDASVLTDFLLGRAPALEVLEREMSGREHQPLHAPDLIELETLNALRGLAIRGAVTDRRATEAARDLASMRLVRYPHGPLTERVWELRGNLTAYDAAYLALTEALDEATLLTADTGLVAAARQSLGRERVIEVE
jgi:predicted nucleic acid-binding protein